MPRKVLIEEIPPDGTPPKLTKNAIIDAIYLKTGFNRTDIRPIFEMIFAEIKDGLVAGRTVELRGVGTFEVKIRNARKHARDPRTGELVPSHKHRIVSFRPGQEIKCAVWKVPETVVNVESVGNTDNVVNAENVDNNVASNTVHDVVPAVAPTQ